MGSLGRKAVWGAAVALWMMVPASSASASDRQGKLDRLLQNTSSGSPRSVIIRVAPDAKDRVQKKLPHRGRGPAEHRLISALAAELDAREIAALASDPDVLSVSVDALVHASANGTTSSTESASASVIQKALGLQGSFTGSAATVAVIDSGLQNGLDFSNRIVGFYDFTGGTGPVASTPIDDFGHGTHVAGLIGSSGVSSNGKYAGVAPGVKLLALKVLDKKGTGRTSNVISALEFAVANKDRFGIKVVNLSLGHPIYESGASDPLVQAVEAAVQSGLIVVAAAGNYGMNPVTGLEGYAGITSPGNAPSAITVGASDTAETDRRDDDRVASFSSRGPTWFDGIAKPDVVAPGSNLVSNQVAGSTLATQYQSLIVREGSTKYLRLSGSSMAAAVVSGLAALMVEANGSGAYHRWQEQSALLWYQRPEFAGAPVLTPNAIKAMLQYSATPLYAADGAVYDALTQGTGEVNGRGALLLAYSADTTRQTGTFWLADAWPPATEFGGVDQPWAQTIVWGTRIVRGSSLIELNQTAWAANIVWGTVAEDDNIVWGTVSEDDNIVWGTLLDGDNIVWGTALFLGNAEYAENIVWGTSMSWDDNIVWGTGLLGTLDGDNIVWGTLDDADNIVWGTLDDDNIVWGTFENGLTVSLTPNRGGL